MHVLTEVEIIYSDVGSAGVLSVVIVSIVLLIGFRSFKKMLIAAIPTIAGIVISLGIITITIGRLNLISSSFLAVLFGIGIDFGIYLLQRTEEELGNGLPLTDAIYKSVVSRADPSSPADSRRASPFSRSRHRNSSATPNSDGPRGSGCWW